VLGIGSSEAICLGLFTSPECLRRFSNQPREPTLIPFFAPFTPCRFSTYTSIPFLFLPKHLHYLHMENHTLGEASTFKFTS
jgi:hypothetical protein